MAAEDPLLIILHQSVVLDEALELHHEVAEQLQVDLAFLSRYDWLCEDARPDGRLDHVVDRDLAQVLLPLAVHSLVGVLQVNTVR